MVHFSEEGPFKVKTHYISEAACSTFISVTIKENFSLLQHIEHSRIETENWHYNMFEN